MDDFGRNRNDTGGTPPGWSPTAGSVWTRFPHLKSRDRLDSGSIRPARFAVGLGTLVLVARVFTLTLDHAL